MSKTHQRKTVRNETPRDAATERGKVSLTDAARVNAAAFVPLPDRLRVIREARGYSEKDVGAALGIAQPTYHLIESGTTALSLSRLLQLAAFYGEPLALFTMGYAVTDEERRTVAAGNALEAGAGFPAPTGA